MYEFVHMEGREKRKSKKFFEWHVLIQPSRTLFMWQIFWLHHPPKECEVFQGVLRIVYLRSRTETVFWDRNSVRVAKLKDTTPPPPPHLSLTHKAV